jgi:hypothetical protein
MPENYANIMPGTTFPIGPPTGGIHALSKIESRLSDERQPLIKADWPCL